MEFSRGATLAVAFYCLAGLAAGNDGGRNAKLDSPVMESTVSIDGGRRSFHDRAVYGIAGNDDSAVRANRLIAGRNRDEIDKGENGTRLLADLRFGYAIYSGRVGGDQYLGNRDNTSPFVIADEGPEGFDQHPVVDTGEYGPKYIGAERDVSLINQPIDHRTVTTRSNRELAVRLSF
ncbi:MAG: hypothetical protein AAF662_14925 [Pseudomonadota bacterium]